MRATLVFITLGAFATALPTGTPDTRAARALSISARTYSDDKDLGETIGDTVGGATGLAGGAVGTVGNIAGEWVDFVTKGGKGKDLGETIGDTIGGATGLAGGAVGTVGNIAGEWVDWVGNLLGGGNKGGCHSGCGGHY